MPLTPWIAAATLSPLTPNLHFQGGRFARAQVAYQALAKTQPLTCLGREGQLLTLLRLDRWPEAIALGEKCQQDEPELMGLLALACLRGGQAVRAQALAVAAWQQEPRAFWPLVARGSVALRWDADSHAAQSFLRLATQRRPDIPEAWLTLLAAVQDPDEAQRVENELARLAPQGYPFTFWSAPLRQRATTAARYSAAFPKGQTFSRTSAPVAVQTLALKHDPRGMLYLEAELDGQRFRLLYDTGGGRHFILTPTALARLKPTFVASTVLMGLQGQSKGAIHRGERLRLGELELHAVPIESTAGNLGGFDGLIGWRVFGERVQRLDLGRGTLTLQEKPSPPEARGVSLPFHLIQDQPVLQLQCERGKGRPNLPLQAILDTGSIEDLFSLRMGERLAGRTGSRRTIQNPLGIGQTHARIELRSLPVPFDLLTQQGARLTSYTQGSAASFLDQVYSPATGFEHDLLLGMDFVSRFSVIELDPVGRRVRLVPQ
jgi:Aspartyl protease